jgi:protein dithiol oxidoreductase (disulfide-forming)
MLKKLLALAPALLIGTAAFAQSPVPGRDYFDLNPPQATESPGKIEVTEFFWYRCPHCYALEPQLTSWVKQLPKDAQFRRVPAIFNDDWAIDARVFYTLESIGEVERLKGDAFAKWVADWAAKQGIDAKKWDETFRSFTVSTKVRRAGQMTQAYKFDGVPALAVQGRYVVSASNSMLAVTDYLIGQSRKAAPASAKK